MFNRIKKKVFVFLFLGLVLLGVISTSNYVEDVMDAIIDDVTDLSNKIQTGHDRLELFAEDLNSMKDEIDNIQTEIASHKNCIVLIPFMNEDNTENQSTDPPQESVDFYDSLYSDDNNYADFYGRLYVPDAGIDVALYYGWDQAITDRADSANIYAWVNCTGETMADHDYQEFGKLFGVGVGTTGYISLRDGSVINIECIDVIDGHNIVSDLVDENGDSVYGRVDYMMYTCRDGWQNIRIWLWKRSN